MMLETSKEWAAIISLHSLDLDDLFFSMQPINNALNLWPKVIMMQITAWNIWFSHVAIKQSLFCASAWQDSVWAYMGAIARMAHNRLTASPESAVSTSCVWDICCSEGQMWWKEYEAGTDGWAETSREYQCAASCLRLCLLPSLSLFVFVHLSFYLSNITLRGHRPKTNVFPE